MAETNNGEPTSPRPQSIEDEWQAMIDNIALDEDCATLDWQLCRDTYLSARKLALGITAINKVTLTLYGGYLHTGDRSVLLHTIAEMGLRPLIPTELGVLCLAEYDDGESVQHEFIIVQGSMFTNKPKDISTDEGCTIELGALLEKDTANYTEDVLNNTEILLSSTLALSGRLLWRQTFTQAEFAEIESSDMSEVVSNFTRIPADDAKGIPELAVPKHYALFSRGVIVGMNIETMTGKVVDLTL